MPQRFLRLVDWFSNKIEASTPCGFEARYLMAYGRPLPITTIMEKFGFKQFAEETLKIRLQIHSIPVLPFTLGS